MHESTNTMNSYDIVIAGAGLAGLLAATRFRQIHPTARILLIEKEAQAGGRLHTPTAGESLGVGGMHYISQDLLEFINRTLLGCARGDDDLHLPTRAAQRVGILQGKRLDEIDLAQFCSGSLAKILGGPSAARQWDTFLKTLEEAPEADQLQPLGKLAKISKKDPFLDVLNIMSLPLGIVDPALATLTSFQQRIRYLEKGLFGGPWTQVIDDILRWNELDLRLGKPILDATFSERRWTITLENEVVTSTALVVAQPPWDAMNWLKREQSPPGFIHLSLKCFPLSAVALTIRFSEAVVIPERIVIPSEKTQVLQLSPREYCIQSLIDYETFFDAPRVVQAVKQVKRSKLKLVKQLGLSEPIEEFLALRPIAWAQETHCDARKFIEEYDATKLNSSQLVFCGDAYGTGYDPDQNLIRSCLAACSTIVI